VFISISSRWNPLSRLRHGNNGENSAEGGGWDVKLRIAAAGGGLRIFVLFYSSRDLRRLETMIIEDEALEVLLLTLTGGDVPTRCSRLKLLWGRVEKGCHGFNK